MGYFIINYEIMGENMKVTNKAWVYSNKQEQTQINKMANDLNITKTSAKLLLNRGIYDINDAKKFLAPKLEDLYNPFRLKDMEKAVKRIRYAIDKREAVWIYGDYDVDGIAGISLLLRFFNSLKFPVNYYIPDRSEEGYGINKAAIKQIADMGGKLLITVDCGITSIDEVAYGNELGIDTIITDHHHCHGTLPSAYAIVNPKQPDCQYDFDELCGTGVAFKLIQALMSPGQFVKTADDYIDLVAIATVADIVSLTKENRIFVKFGLKIIEKTQNLGIRALLEVSGLLDKKIGASHIAFNLAPRINAAGRMGCAKVAVDLLTTENEQDARKIASLLDEKNQTRQELEKKIVEEAFKLINDDPKYQEEKVLVVHKEGWHDGVIGIVASRILEKYYKPTFVLTGEDGIAKGSGRSIPGFDLFNSLNECSELLEKFGGHEQAAGLSLKNDNMTRFRNKINNIADEILRKDDLIPKLICDDELSLEDIDDKLMQELKCLEPFGLGNPGPKFLSGKLELKNFKTVGYQEKHLKMHVEEYGIVLDCIGFNLGVFSNYIARGDTIALVFIPEYNVYNYDKIVQLNVKDIKVINSKDTTKINCTGEYYGNLQFHEYESCFKIFQLNKIPIRITQNKSRRVLEILRQEKKILILVNTIQEVNHLTRLLEAEFKNKKIKLNFFYHESPWYCDEDEVHIVINPNIDKIQYKIYNGIVVYDMFFSREDYYYFFKKNNNKNTTVLYSRGDEQHNLKIFRDVVPTRNKLVVLYKQLKKYSNVKPIYFTDFLIKIRNDIKIEVNEILLANALKVFEEGKLIEYKLDNQKISYKILDVGTRIDITILNSFRELDDRLKNFIEFLKEWVDILEGGYWDGFIK